MGPASPSPLPLVPRTNSTSIRVRLLPRTSVQVCQCTQVTWRRLILETSIETPACPKACPIHGPPQGDSELVGRPWTRSIVITILHCVLYLKEQPRSHRCMLPVTIRYDINTSSSRAVGFQSPHLHANGKWSSIFIS
jgi:hypothetical protein